MSALLLGVDVGSSATKVALVDPDEGIRAVASRATELGSPAQGWAEANPAQWWENLCALIPEVSAMADVRTEQIDAVAVSGMVPAVLVLDEFGQPVRAAILQNDARASVEVGALRRSLEGVDLLGMTGSPLTQQSVAPTLMWLAAHEPELFNHARHVVGSYDWLAHALGAELHCETNWALESGLFTLGDLQLLPEVLEVAHLPAELFAPVRSSGTVVGGVSREAARSTGLAVDTPIVVGGADHVLSAYGAGCSKSGDWLVKLGGAGDVLVVSELPFVDPRLYLDVHPAPNRWLPNGCMATSGSMLAWLWRLTGELGADELELEAAKAAPVSLIMLPYFLGEKSPLHDPDLRGAVLGLGLSHTRADVYRAALEAIAFGFRHHLEIFGEHDISLGVAKVSNGGSRSRLWKQVTADVLGVELYPVKEHPGAALGAAVCAGIGSGALENWQAIDQFVHLDKPVVPNRALAATYDEGYELFRAVADALTPISHRMAGLERTRTAVRDDVLGERRS
jgi:xylulokinase